MIDIFNRCKKFGNPGRLDILIDGQFGSTGKGLFAAWMAEHGPKYDAAITSASPNSGHTAIVDGKKIITHHLPMLGVVRRIPMHLTAASVIDPELLAREMGENMIPPDMVTVHPCATILENSDRNMESVWTRQIASTMQGVGASRSKKMIRSAKIARGVDILVKKSIQFNGEMNDAKIFMEVPQGYSLSLNHSGFYPYVTSRDCTVAQALADANIHPRHLGGVIMTARTYPIRVGHVYDNENNLVGNSGPVYPDQKELDWKQLDIEPEYTTVTKRQRRIFSWSDMQFEEAISVIRPDILFVNFLNYIDREHEKTLYMTIEKTCLDVINCLPLLMAGRGPETHDVSEWMIDR